LIREIRQARPSVEIQTIEVLRHPALAVKHRVLSLPTLIVGDRRWHFAAPSEEIFEVLDQINEKMII
jgi:hypothetical protein